MPHPRNYGIEARGRRIVDAADWVPSSISGQIPYQWLTDNTILVRRGEMTAVYDTVTGHWSSLSRLAAAIHADPAAAGYQNNAQTEYMASPDGRWLMTVLSQGLCAVSTITGTPVFVFAVPKNTFSIVWDFDSKGFTAVGLVDGRYMGRHYSLGARRPADQTDRPLTGESFDEFRPVYPLAGLDGGRILAVPWQTETGDAVFRVWSMSGDPPRMMRVALPAGAELREVEVSPDGRRIGWILDFRGKIDPALGHVPFMPIVPGHSMGEIWVCGIDGSNMVPIATTGAGPDSGPTEYLRWTHDAKQVTFVVRNTLFAVSVDQ